MWRPGSRQSESFRRRYRFLVVRWRPDKWYWGMVYMLRNVFITLVNILVPNDAVIQCSLMLIFLMVGMALQSANRPWRDNRNNFADLVMTFCLCALVVLSLNFANEPSDQGSAYKNAIESAIVLLVVIVTSVFVALLIYAILLQRNRGVREVIHNLSILELAGEFSKLGTRLAKADVDKFAYALGHYPQVDVEDLKHMLTVLGGTSCLIDRDSRSQFRKWLRSSTSKMQLTKRASTANLDLSKGIGPRLHSGDSLGTICRQVTTELPVSNTLCLETSSVEVAEQGHLDRETEGAHTSSQNTDVNENETQSAEPASVLGDSENVGASVRSLVVGLDTISESSMEIEIESPMIHKTMDKTMPILSPSARPCFATNNFVSDGASGSLSWNN